MDGTMLKKLREEKGETQRIAAFPIGVTETTLSKYETGKVDNPPLKVLLAIAEHYGVKVSELIGEK